MLFDSFNLFWIDIILLFVSMAFLKGGITGEFYSVGRGSLRAPIAKVKSVRARAIFLFIAAGLFTWVIQDFTRKIGR